MRQEVARAIVALIRLTYRFDRGRAGTLAFSYFLLEPCRGPARLRYIAILTPGSGALASRRGRVPGSVRQEQMCLTMARSACCGRLGLCWLLTPLWSKLSPTFGGEGSCGATWPRMRLLCSRCLLMRTGCQSTCE